MKLGFSSIFWNTAWTARQAPTTLGVLVDPAHPAFAAFPTESHSNWQWWYLVSRAGAMLMDPLPRDVRPIVQVIDDWFTARKLALAFEARVNGGRLLVTSIDLDERSRHEHRGEAVPCEPAALHGERHVSRRRSRCHRSRSAD